MILPVCGLLLGLAAVLLAAWLLVYGWTDIYIWLPDKLYDFAPTRPRKDHLKQDRAKHRMCKAAAKMYEKRIQSVLARRNLARITRDGRKVQVDPVRFDTVIIPYDGTAIYFHVDGSRLPRGVLIEHLLEQEVSDAITRAIGRACRPVDTMEKYGVFLMVNMGEGYSRLPKRYHFHIKDNPLNVLDMLPKTKPMEVPVGMGENRTLYTIDLFEDPGRHTLIAGASGWGKTAWIRQALVSMAVRNSPKDIQLTLFDFKRGVGLRIFERLPHTRCVVREKDDAETELRVVIDEMERRYDLFDKLEVEDIHGYNYGRRKNLLPVWLVVIDELADLMLDPDKGKDFQRTVERLILRVAQLGRGAGIFVWAGTQTPKAEVVTTLIKYNMVVKLAFNCTHNSASKIILDNGKAVGLDTPGRMILQEPGNAGVELQAPWLSYDHAKRWIAQIEKGDTEPPPDPMTEIWHYAIKNLGGSVPINKLVKTKRFGGTAKVGGDVSRFQYDPDKRGPVIEHDDARYILLPSNGGRIPRRLHALNGDDPPDHQAFAEIVRMSHISLPLKENT